MRWISPTEIGSTPAKGSSSSMKLGLEARARAIHERVLTLDTHVDINPANFRADGPNYTQRLPRTQVDLVKMREGGLDAAFLIVYVGQTPQLNDSGYVDIAGVSNPSKGVGTLTPGQGFEPDDIRARHPRFTAEMMAANQPVVAGLRRVAERHGEHHGGRGIAKVAAARKQIGHVFYALRDHEVRALSKTSAAPMNASTAIRK